VWREEEEKHMDTTVAKRENTEDRMEPLILMRADHMDRFFISSLTTNKINLLKNVLSKN
jgi:hypothetical protein